MGGNIRSLLLLISNNSRASEFGNRKLSPTHLLLVFVLAALGSSGCQKKYPVLGDLDLPADPMQLEWFSNDFTTLHVNDDPEAMRRLHAVLGMRVTHPSHEEGQKQWAMHPCRPNAVGLRDGRVLVVESALAGAKETGSFWRWLRKRYPCEHRNRWGERCPILTSGATVRGDLEALDEMRYRSKVEAKRGGLSRAGIEQLVRRIVSRLPRYVIVEATGQDRDKSRSSIPTPSIECVARLREAVTVQACIVPWDRYWYLFDVRQKRIKVYSAEAVVLPIRIDRVKILISRSDPPGASLRYHSPELGRWLPAADVPINERLSTPTVSDGGGQQEGR